MLVYGGDSHLRGLRGVDWASQASTWITTGINSIAVPILNAQFGGPQPGQYYANTKTGVTQYSLPSNSAQVGVTSFPTMGGGISGTTLLIGGVVLIGMFAVMGRGK